MDILIRLLLVLFLSYFSVGSTSETVTPEPQPSAQSLTIIDGVQAQITKSYPAQIVLHVTGSQPDGCDFPVQVEQRREGNMVIVRIYREVPLEVMCPAILRMYDDNIRLDGTFDSGAYTIQVNDYAVEVTV